MAGNSFGNIFKISTFGESHGKAIGCIIDGCPSNLSISENDIQIDLDRRKPGQSDIVTSRNEGDKVEILSGIFNGKTTGAPIALIIKNKDQQSKDYTHLKDSYRPSHSDFVYHKKYGNRDYKGGGRSSARETAARVMAGAVAKVFLNKLGIKINAFVSQVGSIKMSDNHSNIDISHSESNIVRCPDPVIAEQMINQIKQAKKEGDTLGGIVYCQIENCPVGLGEPVFDKLHADLAKAMMSINATRGFEIGSGFKAVQMKGSEHNDEFIVNEEGHVKTKTNNSGGIQGGISNGMPIYFNVAFKPVSTIMQKQNSINTDKESIILEGKGRHDPCVVPRAVPIVEAMAALVIADFYLRLNAVQE